MLDGRIGGDVSRIAAIVVWVLSWSLVAQAAPDAPDGGVADPVAEGKRHFIQGVALYNEMNYNAALAEFEAASRVHHQPVLRYNIGLCLKGLFRYSDAIDSLRWYLNEASGDPKGITPQRKAEVEQMISEMKALLVELPLTIEPAGTNVIIDGRSVGTAPLPTLSLAAGHHVIELSAEGYKPARREIELAAGAPAAPLSIKLKGIPKTGRLQLSFLPSNATVKIDGKRLEPPYDAELGVGGHAVEVTLPGYHPRTAEIVVAAGQTREMSMTLEKVKLRIWTKWWFWTATVGDRHRGGAGDRGGRARRRSRHQRRAHPPGIDRHEAGQLSRLLFALLLAAGCTNYRTEIMVGFLSDFHIPGDLPDGTKTFSIRFGAERNGVRVFTSHRCITSEADLPGSVGLYSAEDLDTEVDLILEGYQVAGGCDPGEDTTTPAFATRTSTLQLVSEQTLFYRMALVASCLGKSCGANESCVEGFCRPKAIDPKAVPPYRMTSPKMEETVQCDSGTGYIVLSSGEPVPRFNPFGCAPDEECIEATCYKKPAGVDAGIPMDDLATPVNADLNLGLPACVPFDCAMLGASCGTRFDGCGQVLVCGPPCTVANFGPAGNLAPSRTAFGVVQTASRVYLLGGEDGTFAATANVQTATILPGGTLSVFADAPFTLGQARQALAVAQSGPVVYLVGGQLNDGKNPPSATGIVESALIDPAGVLGAPQTAGMLGSARDSHAAAVVKRWLYVFGGQDKSQAPLRAIERALIQPDGSLGAFEPAGTLGTARISPVAIVTDEFVFIAGGSAGGTQLLDTIERAPITFDGSLGRFAQVAGRLASPRGGAGVAILGNDVYLIGGRSGNTDLGMGGFLDSIEHAQVGSGGLGAFSILPGVALGTARGGHGVVVTGNSLFVLGGLIDTPAILASIERAALQ
jgi:hypothetical protein